DWRRFLRTHQPHGCRSTVAPSSVHDETDPCYASCCEEGPGSGPPAAPAEVTPHRALTAEHRERLCRLTVSTNGCHVHGHSRGVPDVIQPQPHILGNVRYVHLW